MANRITSVGVALLALIASAWADSGEKEKQRISESANIITGIFSAPDKGVPQSVMDGTKCVVVIPGLKKAALLIGGDYGRGIMTCRTGEDFKGPWSAPIMMASGGGDIGIQLGVEGTDVVILVVNDSGARSLISKNKLKLGADASVAAGPVGSTTGTSPKAEMFSYSRTHGVFAGAAVSGMTLRVDDDANKDLYGEKVTPQQILAGSVTMPEQAKPLIEALQQAGQKAASSK